MKPKILVLATLDEHGAGHAWSIAKKYEEHGAEVQEMYLLRSNASTKNYFIDTINKQNVRYLWYKFLRLIMQLPFAPFSKMRWWYMGIDFVKAEDIIKRLTFTPDYIHIGTHQFFLSPKAIYELYKRTNAKIVFSMVDDKLLGGGCPYPVWGCREYENGCAHCPVYPYMHFVRKNIIKQKRKYLKKMPFHLLGTSYDLKKAQKVDFLKHATMHSRVGCPDIPFKMNKEEAREFFDIPENEYVIMVGSTNNNNPNKGFKQLLESLLIFDKTISDRSVTLLMLGKEIPSKFNFKNIKIKAPGFLDLRGLFTAYYACDVYVSPSVEDSGPYMVNYAIACGRPVIAFPVGIALDIVINKKTGWLTSCIDINEYAEGLKYFYNSTKEELRDIERDCIILMANYRNSNFERAVCE